MSKLSHSNQETMDEIERANNQNLKTSAINRTKLTLQLMLLSPPSRERRMGEQTPRRNAAIDAAIAQQG